MVSNVEWYSNQRSHLHASRLKASADYDSHRGSVQSANTTVPLSCPWEKSQKGLLTDTVQIPSLWGDVHTSAASLRNGTVDMSRQHGDPSFSAILAGAEASAKPFIYACRVPHVA